MPVELSWSAIAVRLSLTVFAGIIIGFNRGEHGRPAGMRTTLLVCLTASLSMILANTMMNSTGKTHDSFVVLDLMRLPLGVLSGMGFIGAGTILRKGNLVLGITTAATLWYVTLMGMCFGAGDLGLGLATLALGCGTLWGLKYAEAWMRQDIRGTLTLHIIGDAPTDAELHQQIARTACQVTSWGAAYDRARNEREISCEIQWRPPAGNIMPPPVVNELRGNAAVKLIRWQPQGIPDEPSKQQSKPTGTPIPTEV